MLNEIMDTLTPAQQALITSLVDGQSVKVSDAHPKTLEALQGQGIVEVDGEFVVLSDAFVDDLEVTIPEPEVSVTDEEPEHDFVEGAVKDTILMMRLGMKIKIQVDSKGTQVELPAGSLHPVISYHEENTRGRNPKRIKWYTLLYVPAKITFLMNGSGHQLVEVKKDELTK